MDAPNYTASSASTLLRWRVASTLFRQRILGGASFAKPAPETGRAWRWIMWWSAALCVALTFASPAARAGALEDCSQNQDVDLKIKGCTINISTRPGDREFLPACFAEPSS